MVQTIASAQSVASGATLSGAGVTFPGYRHVDIYYSVDVGTGSESVVLTVDVSEAGGTTWRAGVPVRDLGTTGGNYVTSKTLTADGSGILRLDINAPQFRVKAANGGDSAASVTLIAFGSAR